MMQRQRASIACRRGPALHRHIAGRRNAPSAGVGARAGLALSFVLLVAGCTKGSTVECTPACPSGWQCTESGCVSDGTTDLAVTVVDQAVGCSPACAGATPFCRDGRCVACLADGDCPFGFVCRASGQSATCLPGCSDDARCGGGGKKCCSGTCTDTSSDPLHCGACGTACMVDHARGSCAAGACTLGTCAPGWADCNARPDDGCEVNLRADAANCAACGTACALPNAIAGCAGSCYVRACNFGWDNCNAKDDDGCETNVAGDIRNCGACGAACPAVAHGKSTCVNAACQLLSCDANFADCDGQVANGCETSTASDANNCGACGNKCAQGLVCQQSACTCPNCVLPNAKSACVNLKCVVGTCNAGYGDCDGLPQNGCERSLATDASNCGQCGLVCAQGLVCTNGSCTCPQCNLPNAQSECINNVCTLKACLPGFANCDGDPKNGCEVDLGTDRNNCGKCGNACGPKTCQGALCVDQVPIDTFNFMGYTEYPLDPEICACCNGRVTTKQTADAFCKLAGYAVSTAYVSAMVKGSNCYCYNCIQANVWSANCCAGVAVRPVLTSVTCQ